MKKIMLVAFLILVAIPLAIAGAFLAENWNDEPLRSEVKESLNWQPPAHAFEDNGYLVFRGIDAPIEQDPAQVGRKILETDIKSYLASKNTFDSSPQIEKPTKPDNFPTSSDLQEALCAYTKTENCAAFYLRSDESKLASLLSSQKVLIDRFLAVQKSRNYVEVIPPSFKFEFPNYKYLVDASELRRMQAIAEIREGNLENGIALFTENAQFSRRLLSSSTTLLSHLIALAMVQHDMRILSELMTRYPRIARFENELRPVLTPISGPEYSMRNPLKGELDIALNFFNSMRGGLGNDHSMLPIKLNATINLAYQTGLARLDAAGASANRLDDALSAYRKQRKAMMGFSILNIYFYNPAGKILLNVSEPSYAAYVERHHDTDGYIRLVATQAKLISENVSADKIPEALKNLGPDFCNPYSGLPMEWDAGHRKLRFQGRQPSNHVPGGGHIYEVQFPPEA